MKNYLILLVLIAGWMSACKDGASSSDATNNGFSSVLPSSTGGADEIMFIIPDQLFTTATKKSINNEYHKIYRILPEEEFRFNISKVEFSVVNNLMFRFRNIVLLASENQQNPSLQMARELLSTEQLTQLENGSKKTFILKNVWSKPQNVVLIFGENEQDLQTSLVNSAPSVMDQVAKSDLEEYKKIAFISGTNVSLKEQWAEYHNVHFDVPSDYKLAENDGNFVSLRKDVHQGMIFIYFDVINYSDKVPDFNNGVALRNERGYYVSSDNEGSYMVSDSTLGFQTTKTIDGNVIRYETSGLWHMENDFMGGPFINQYIIDNDRNRVIFLDGFIYAPGDKKKKYMRQLEAIFSTLELTN